MTRLPWLCLLLSLLSGCGSLLGVNEAPVEPVDVSGIQPAVARFHLLYNAGDFTTLYQEAVSPFSDDIDAEQFQRLMLAMQQTLGTVQWSGIVEEFPPDPEQWIIVRVQTGFAEGQEAEEVFRFRKTDTGFDWQSYRIDSDTLPADFPLLVEEDT